jgi:hypothetical protein
MPPPDLLKITAAAADDRKWKGTSSRDERTQPLQLGELLSSGVDPP